MSLVAWFPFDGDIKDYSGYNLNLKVYTSPSFDSDGKIGKCLTTGGLTIPASHTKRIFNKYNQSICFWYYNTEETPSTTGHHIITGPNGMDGKYPGRSYSLFSYPNNNDLHLSMYNESGNGKIVAFVISGVLTNKKWTHVCLTNRNGTIRAYINGEVKHTLTINPDDWDTSFIYDYTLINNSVYHKINDFRIYDHALSDKEVYEISRAKILHYTFDENKEPTKNLAAGVHLGFGGSRWEKVSSYPPGLPVKPVDVYRRKDTNTYWGFFSDFLPTNPNPYGKIITISCWYYLEENYSGVTSSSILGALNAGDTVYNTLSTSLKNTFSNQVKNKWVYGEQTLQITTNAYSYNYIIGWIGGVIEDGAHCYIANFQIEEKDHATLFVNGERSSEIIEDSSGFGNNAIIYFPHTPQWVENSRIGKGAYKFGNNYARMIVPNKKCKVTDQISIAVWAYRDNWQDTTSERIISCTETGGWHMGFNDIGGKLSFVIYSNSQYHNAAIPLSSLTSGWHHFVGTYDGRYVKLYVDSVLANTTDKGSQYLIVYNANNDIIIGAEAGQYSESVVGAYWNGLIDDVRIYAIALTDDDIKNIYSNRASIDDRGNLYINTIEEYNRWDEQIKANNLIINGNAEFGNNTNFYSLKYDNIRKCFYSNDKTTVLSEDFIPVNRKDTYKLYGEFKDLAGSDASYFFGLACYDAKKREIKHEQVHFIQNTKTTLAVALKPGDTTVTLTSAANWSQQSPGQSHHTKTIGVWTANSEYPPYTYTRTLIPYLSISGNVLTLASVWSGAEIPAGTPVANMYSGGTYLYIAADSATSEWVKREGTISGWSSPGDEENKFRYGTEYVKILILPNYNKLSTLGIRAMKFWNATRDQDISSTAWSLVDGITNLNEKSIIKTSKISEVGIVDGLVAWYPLNGNTKDYSVNGYHGTIVGNVVAANGLYGRQCYKFPGDAQAHIKIPTKVLQNIQNFTIALLYNSSNLAKETNAILHGTNTGDNNISIELYSNKINLLINNLVYTFNINSNINTWYHIAFVRECNTLKLYRDSQLIGEVSCSSEVINIIGYLLLGQEQDAVGGEFDSGQSFEGKMQDVRIYDRALTSEEVAILYQRSFDPKSVKITKNSIYLYGEVIEIL